MGPGPGLGSEVSAAVPPSGRFLPAPGRPPRPHVEATRRRTRPSALNKDGARRVTREGGLSQRQCACVETRRGTAGSTPFLLLLLSCRRCCRKCSLEGGSDGSAWVATGWSRSRSPVPSAQVGEGAGGEGLHQAPPLLQPPPPVPRPRGGGGVLITALLSAPTSGPVCRSAFWSLLGARAAALLSASRPQPHAQSVALFSAR